MTLAIRALEGELLPPGSTIRVVGRVHWLSGARFDLELEAGLSIEEIIAEVLVARPDLAGRRDFLVEIDGHAILERNWRRVRVKPGATVQVMPRLQGGPNNQLMRTVLSAVVVVAAIIAAPYIAPGVIAALGAIGITVSVATATTLATAGIMLAGTLAINALFPVSRAALADGSSTGSFNSIQGAQNQSNADGAVTVVLGRHRQSPFYAAKPYTEISGADQYLRLLFCFGYGPQEIDEDELKIGDTPLSSFTGVTLEIREGYVDDDPVTLYPGQVDEVALSLELDTIVAPFYSSPGPWFTQTTGAETDQISVDYTAVDGIFATDPQGDEVRFTVIVATQYRLAGSSDPWAPAPYIYFNRSTDPLRLGQVIDVARGQYEVRARRETGRGVPQYTRDKIIWTALRSIKNEAPINFPKPLALVALRIKASDQLSGVVNTFNGITTSVVKSYSGAGDVWLEDEPSQNPADLFRHVLQGPANARPVADALIDLENLQAFWLYCDEQGFKFNQVITGAGSVYDKLSDICAAARAVPTFIDGKWGAIWDRPEDSIVQHFTPRNSWGFELSRVYAQQPHGWRVKFIDETNGFAQDERKVFDDGYSDANATLFEAIQFPGVTDPELIWKHGRFHIAQARLRPEKISLSTGWEHLIVTRGDRVRVTHDVALIGLASGRIKSIAGQVVTFDETVTIETGKTYAVSFRVAEDVRVIDRSVDEATPAGEHNALTLVGDLSDLSPGDLFAFGETERATSVYRVQGIANQKDLVATLALVDDAPAISLADQGAIPPYVPNVTIPPDPFTLPPRDLRLSELVDGQGAIARALVQLSWQVPRFGNIRIFEVQYQDVDNSGPWVTVPPGVAPPATSIAVPISRAGVFSFRVRCLFVDGSASAWATIANANLLALSTAPGNVTNLHQRSVDGQTVLDWSTVEDRRLLSYEIRKGSAWDTSLTVGETVAQPPWATLGDGTYHVRAFALSPFGTRVYSEATATIAIGDSIISRNIIVERDEQASGWNGGIGLDGGVVDGAFIRTDASGTISQPFAEAIVEQLGLEGVQIAIFVSGQIVDVGRLADCRFWMEFDAVGVLQGADFLGTSDFLATDDILGAGPTRQIRALPIWRFGGAEDTDVFAPADIFAEPDIFTAGITWGDWVAIASGTRVARYYQPGLVLISDAGNVDATGTKFRWFVDVPDRTDDYTNLAVPDTGLPISFYARGFDGAPDPGATAIPFKGGPNNSLVPHVQRAIVDGLAGDEVEISDLTLSGCTVHVLNAGVAVTRAGVNLLVRGY